MRGVLGAAGLLTLPPLLVGTGVLSGVLGVRIGYRLHENFRCLGLPPSDRRNIELAVKEALGLLTFHSQTCQDKWVHAVVYPDVTDGYFVDVGAASGERESNSKFFEDRGWRGLCVDPFPSDMGARRCAVFREVVAAHKGERVRFRKAGYLGGIDEHIDRWRDEVADKQVIELETTTLDDILARAGAPSFIHYMSLDVEGAELEALRGVSFDRYRFGVLSIEHNFEEPKRSQVRTFLDAKGYGRVHTIEQDDFYMDRALAARRGLAPA
jgi:FkbM family methyltransferase